MTCAAPMYYIGSEYKGAYSNNEDLLPLTSDEDNFGLDDYEPLFFHPLSEWVGYGEFSVFLKFDNDTDYNKDIFYFCHVSIMFMMCHFLMLKFTSISRQAFVSICTLFVDPPIHDWPHQASQEWRTHSKGCSLS